MSWILIIIEQKYVIDGYELTDNENYILIFNVIKLYSIIVFSIRKSQWNKAIYVRGSHAQNRKT